MNGKRSTGGSTDRPGTSKRRAFDWAAFDSLSDRAVKRAAAKDPDALPTRPEFWARARPVMPAPKESVSLRLDREVLAWFRARGAGYQTRINAVLGAFMVAHEG